MNAEEITRLARLHFALYVAEVEASKSYFKVAQGLLVKGRRLQRLRAEILRGRVKAIIAFDRAMDGRQ